MKLFAGSANKPLSQKVAEHLNVEVSPIEVFTFPDGERRVQIQAPVLEEDAVVIQPTNPPVDQNYMELFLIIDGLKRSGAKSVTVVIPYLGYQRQDHVFRDGEAVSVEVIIAHLQSQLNQLDKVITFDLHTPKISDLFTIPNNDLSALPLFAEEIKRLLGASLSSHSQLEKFSDASTPADLGVREQSSSNENFSPKNAHREESIGAAILVSPDMGGIRRIEILSKLLDDMPWVTVTKNRDLESGSIEDAGVEWHIGSRSKNEFTTALIVDDMISSGGTMVKAAEIMSKEGIKDSYAFATHPVFSKDAPKLLQDSPIQKVFVSDSIFVPEEKQFEKLKILSIAREIARELSSK